MDKPDGADGLRDGTRACCCGGVRGRWIKLCNAAEAEEWELDEGPCIQAQQ